ncbi:hypothetical protein [Streptomyces sp. NPDC055134]
MTQTILSHRIAVFSLIRPLKEPGTCPTVTRCIEAVRGEATDPAGPREVSWDSSGLHEGELAAKADNSC